MAKLTLITGGARSGKTAFALAEGEKLAGPRLYLATAGEPGGDREMRLRIERHRAERGDRWISLEEPRNLCQAIPEALGGGAHAVVLVDCLTLWLTNLLMEEEAGGRKVEPAVEEFISTLADISPLKGEVFMVTNEVGMGIVPENALARKFRDLAGGLNRRVAEVADRVWLVAAGLPLRLK